MHHKILLNRKPGGKQTAVGNSCPKHDKYDGGRSRSQGVIAEHSSFEKLSKTEKSQRKAQQQIGLHQFAWKVLEDLLLLKACQGEYGDLFGPGKHGAIRG